MWLFFQYIWFDCYLNPDKYVERAANIFMIMSGALVSFSPELSVQAWTFMGFFIGHVIWIITGLRMKKITLVEMNVGFLLLDTWAIWVRL
jgi:uncharacterized membrane protein